MQPTPPTPARPCRPCRPCLLARLAGWPWLLLWGALLLGPLAVAGLPDGRERVLRLDHAAFQRLDAPASGAWQAVALPDTWAARGLPLAGQAHYRLRVHLPQAPQGSWALGMDRLSNVHSIWINGVLVRQRGEVAATAGAPRVLPVLVEIPAALLQAGDNQIDLQWRLAARAGLSAPLLGPADQVALLHDRARRLDQTLPQVMNVAGGALAGFLLLVWWQRRQEQAIGLFGVLWLLLSLRNYSYTVDATPLPSPWGDVLFFAAQCVSVVLLGLFVLALSGEPQPRLQRLLRVLGPVLPLLGAVAALGDGLHLLRLWVYPLLSVLSVLALWLLLRALRRTPGVAMAGLVVGLGAVVAAGVHDYMFLHGRLPVTGMYWIPLAVPLGCLSFALLLIHRLVRALAISEELTQRLEARVAERTLALQAADAAKTRFLAAASHDLRQPVSAIGLLVGLARERAADAGLRAMLDRTQAAVLALERLLRGLLDLSRMDTPEALPRRQAVPLQPLFDALALHHQADAQARGLRLRLRPSAAVVDTDPVLLEQVLRNLVGNALRHTHQGGVLVVARCHGPHGVLLQVWDTGIGIPADQQQRVFEPFVQLHNADRPGHGGQGLGLAIVRRAVDLLGHPLTLCSVPGRGTRFSIALPRVDRPGPWPPLPPPGPPADPAPLAGRSLWLLDDDAGLRDTLALCLAGWGAQVRQLDSLAALHGTLASQAAAPDLLLTDLHLPDGDGWQAIAQLRGRHGPVAALLITGDSQAARHAHMGQPAVPVLGKPLQPAALLQALMDTLPS